MSRAGTVTIRLDGDSATLIRELNRANQRTNATFRNIQRQVTQTARRLAVIGTAAAAAFAVVVRQSSRAIDALAKQSDQLGIATEKMAALNFAAGLAGVSQEQLTQAIARQQRVIADANQGLASAARALQRLGLSAQELRNLSPDQQFRVLADALNGLENQTERTALAQEVFGRSGAALLPLLSRGSEGLAQAEEEARKLGITLSRLDAAKVEAANDAMARARAVFTGVGNQLTVGISPAIRLVADNFRQAALESDGFAGGVSTGTQVGATALAALANTANTARVAILGIQEGVLRMQIAFARLRGQDVFITVADRIEQASTKLISLQRILARVGARALDDDYAQVREGAQRLREELEELRKLDPGSQLPTALGEIIEQADALAERRRNIEFLPVFDQEALRQRLNELNEELRAQLARPGGGTGDLVATLIPDAAAADRLVQDWLATQEQAGSRLLEIQQAIREQVLSGEQALSEQLIGLSEETARERVAAKLREQAELARLAGEDPPAVTELEIEKQVAQERLRVLQEFTNQRAALEKRVRENGLLGAGVIDSAGLLEENRRAADAMIEGWRIAGEQRREAEAAVRAAVLQGETELGEQLINLAMRQAREKVEAEFNARREALEALGLSADPNEQFAQEEAIREEFLARLREFENERTRLESDAARERQRIAEIEARFKVAQVRFYGDTAMTILGGFAQRSQAIARALFAFERSKAAADVFIQTQVAAAKAMATIPPPAGLALAKVIQGMGIASAAAVASTAITGPGGGGGFGGAMGAPASIPFDDGTRDGEPGPRSQSAVQIIFQGDVYGWDSYVEERIMRSMRDAADGRDVLIFGRNSRQAADL